MKITLTPEQEDEVVRKSIKEAVEYITQQRGWVMLAQRGRIFSLDPKEDILLLTRLIDAMILTHNFYSNEEEKIDQLDVD